MSIGRLRNKDGSYSEQFFICRNNIRYAYDENEKFIFYIYTKILRQKRKTLEFLDGT